MTGKILNNDFKEIVFGRRSIRSYDPTYKIPKKEMLEIIQEATTAPSSVNLQPWRFVIVESETGKEKLRPLIRKNTLQNDTSSAMILIFGDMECYKYADEMLSQAVSEGLMTEDMKKERLNFIMPYYENFSKEKMNEVLKIDSGLVAMQLMLVARTHGYDTNAIGGFESDRLAETFGMDPKRYVPSLIISIGKAAGEGHQSVRFAAEKITTFD